MKFLAHPHDPVMLLLSLAFDALFVGTLLAGFYLFSQWSRLFGNDATLPSENHSARTYNKLQVLVLWVHALALTGAFALGLH
jgi:hypothetical protein